MQFNNAAAIAELVAGPASGGAALGREAVEFEDSSDDDDGGGAAVTLATVDVPITRLRNIEWMNKKGESDRDQWFCQKTARLLATHFGVEVFIVTDGAFDMVAYNTDGSNKKLTVMEVAPNKESVVPLHNGIDHFDGLRYMGPG